MAPALRFHMPPTLVAAGILPSSFGPTHQLALLYIDALLDSLYNHGYYPHKRKTSLPLVPSLVVIDTHRVMDADSPIFHPIFMEKVSLLPLPPFRVIRWNRFLALLS